MKEKKHYETPRFSVTQVITEGVFAASGNPGELVVPDDTKVHIKEQGGWDDITFDAPSDWE